MAEYARTQQNQQNRIITNSKLGSKQFKRFVDNRKISYPPIVQFDGPVRNSNTKFEYDRPLSDLYYGGSAVHENDYKSPNAILGWASMQTFDAIGDAMKNFKVVMHHNSDPGDDSPSNDYTANQLTTSGVDTCTIVVISRGQKNLMAHMNIGPRNPGDRELENIKREIPRLDEANAPLQIFISLLDDRKMSEGRAKFARELIGYYYNVKITQDVNKTNGKLEEELTNGIVDGKENIHILVRPNSLIGYAQHPEIGVYLYNGELHIFGSFSNSLENEQKISDVDKLRDFDLPLNAPQEEFNSLSQREKTLLELAPQEQSPSQYQSPLQDLEPVPLQESYPVPRHRASHHYINPFFLKGMLHP